MSCYGCCKIQLLHVFWCFVEETICKSDTCLNGGTCTVNYHLEEPMCSCTEHFHGTYCELVRECAWPELPDNSIVVAVSEGL